MEGNIHHLAAYFISFSHLQILKSSCGVCSQGRQWALAVGGTFRMRKKHCFGRGQVAAGGGKKVSQGAENEAGDVRVK